MKKVALEEHCFTRHVIDYLLARTDYPMMDSVLDEKGQPVWRKWNSEEEEPECLPAFLMDKLCDTSEGRLSDMDAAGIDIQVLSFPLNIDQLSAAEGTALTREINDVFAAAIKKHPDRFAGFAALFLKDPLAAADELERTVKEYGFKGTLVPSHVNGKYLDAKSYWPFFERASKLGVPVYIHPTFPPPGRLDMYADYPEMAGAMWGYAAEASHTAVRLMCSGIFDEYPDLKIILGHMGEALPFWMSRLDIRRRTSAAGRSRSGEKRTETVPLAEKLKKQPRQYVRENFFVTTSGMFWEPALICTMLALGADRILFAADYPFQQGPKSVEFIASAPISEGDKEKIFYTNAAQLLNL